MAENWRALYEGRMTTPAEAVARIRSGDTVNVPPFAPVSLLNALWDRREELRDVRLQFNSTTASLGWLEEGSDESFSLDFEFFIGSFARGAADAKRGFYLPNIFSRSFKAHDESRPGTRTPNVGLVACSPPNEDGMVHFGAHHWTKRSLVRRVGLAIAEVDPNLLAVHGDIYAHVSEFDCFVPGESGTIGPVEIEEMLTKVRDEWRDDMRNLVGRLSQDQLRPIFSLLPVFDPATVEIQMGLTDPSEFQKTISGYLSEVIEDGDCLQIGIGEPSSVMVKLGTFDRKQDLGMHTELMAPGTAGLVERGVINGRRKNQFAGQVVASAWTGGNDEDFRIIQDNPTFQLFDNEFVLDVARIAANDRQVAVNNAVSIDLLGQINAESVFGGRMLNGTGGLPEAHIGAFLSKGGKAIILLPSTAMDGAISRIVPMLEAGSMVTIPRYFADIVITEYGIARLLGKNHRERVDELIAVAHPDHRSELRAAARGLLSA